MTKDEALLIAEPYIVEALARHDEAYDRHPATEAERQIIVDDLEAVRKALQQLELEPVGEVCKSGIGDFPVISWRAGYVAKIGDKFYTTPPQRQPLTDEQIEELANPLLRNVGNATVLASYAYFARAIEAAHGIKENT